MITVRRLHWDPWNAGHIARHEVAPEEVEQVCHGEPVVRQSYLGRLVVLGPTLDGRLLAVILEAEGQGVFYPITARLASRKERAMYERWKGGEGR